MLKQMKIQVKPLKLSSTSLAESTIITATTDTSILFQDLNNYDFDINTTKTTTSILIALFSACLIHLDYQREENIIATLYNNDDMEENADAFLLLADAYYAKKNYAHAKRFYHLLLTQVKEFLVNLDIWLKYGNCCSHLNEVEEAINAYRNAVNLDDSNCEAALSLVNILKRNALMFDEASSVIRNTLSHHHQQDQEKKKLSTEVSVL